MSNTDYSLLLKQVEALIDGESDPIANTANVASLLYHNLADVNWVGFYFLKGDELVLGPFSGQPACTRIPLGKGVCGTAFVENKTQVVDDVHAFPGHIACDAASESEVVVPLQISSLQGVFDIDSPKPGRFATIEKEFFESVAQALSRNHA